VCEIVLVKAQAITQKGISMRLLMTAVLLLGASNVLAQEAEYVIVETNNVIQFWLNNFLWSLLWMLVVGWFIPKLFWFSKFSLIIRVFVSVVCSVAAMFVIGTLWAVLIISLGSSLSTVIETSINNLSGAISLYSQLGAQTTVGWFAAIVVRIIALIVRDIRSSRKTE